VLLLKVFSGFLALIKLTYTIVLEREELRENFQIFFLSL